MLTPSSLSRKTLARLRARTLLSHCLSLWLRATGEAEWMSLSSRAFSFSDKKGSEETDDEEDDEHASKFGPPQTEAACEEKPETGTRETGMQLLPPPTGGLHCSATSVCWMGESVLQLKQSVGEKSRGGREGTRNSKSEAEGGRVECVAVVSMQLICSVVSVCALSVSLSKERERVGRGMPIRGGGCFRSWREINEGRKE